MRSFLSIVLMSNPNRPVVDKRPPYEKYLDGYNPLPAPLDVVVEAAVRSVPADLQTGNRALVCEAIMPEVLAVSRSGGLEKNLRNGALEAEVRELVWQCLETISDERKDLEDAQEILPGMGRVIRVIAPHCCLVRANVDGREIRVCVPSQLSNGGFPEPGKAVRVRVREDVKTQRSEPTAEILELV